MSMNYLSIPNSTSQFRNNYKSTISEVYQNSRVNELSTHTPLCYPAVYLFNNLTLMHYRNKVNELWKAIMARNAKGVALTGSNVHF